jgi:tetratricopeptide (TPR) repeat protein
MPRSLDWVNAVTGAKLSAGPEEPSGTALPPLGNQGQPPAWSDSRAGRGTPVPDWLGARMGTASEPGSPTPGEPSAEFESDVALPDWLADLDTEARAFSSSPTAKGPEEQQPEWSRADAARTPGGTGRPSNVQRTEQTADAGQHLGWDQEHLRPTAPPPASGDTPEPAQPLREPIPLGNPPVAEASPVGVPSLGGAKAELERGNLAAAVEIYGKLIRKGKFLEEISRDLREALHRHPVEVSIWQALGDAYIRANRIQEALDSYTKAEELLR